MDHRKLVDIARAADADPFRDRVRQLLMIEDAKDRAASAPEDRRDLSQ